MSHTVYRLLGVVFWGLVSVTNAQQVEPLWPIPASVMTKALGFNAAASSEAAVEAAWRIHATEIRMQPGWSSVQNYATGVFTMDTNSSNALDWCQTYGLEPLFVAAYAPPWQKIMTLTVASTVPVGSMVIPVQETISTIDPPYCHVMNDNNTQIVSKWAYYGGLIDSVNTSAKTLTLASATTVSLTAGTTLRVNRLRYPSCANQSASDPSVQAYRQYILFLANELANRGMQGRIEIWNEPPWTHDNWDNRSGFYDNPPAALVPVWGDPARPQSPNFGFVEALRSDTLPAGVTLVWGGTNKSGACSLLAGRMITPMDMASTDTYGYEAFHPYCGNMPELDILPDWLVGSGNIFANTIPGGNPGSNFRSAMDLNFDHWENNGWGIQQVVSECGLEVTDTKKVFSDTFNDNTNAWSNIGTGTNQATIGTDPDNTAITTWYPSHDSINAVGSTLDFAPLSILNAPVSVDMNVRVDAINHTDANRFSVTLHEQGTGGCYAMLCIRPGGAAYLGYYDQSGNWVNHFLNHFTFPDTQTYVTFRLTVTNNGDGSMTLAGFYFDTITQDYVSLGSPATDASSQTGVFDRLNIWSRNASGSYDNRAYFHAVTVNAENQGLRLVDDFDDNQNTWSNIGTGAGKAVIASDPNGSGEMAWYPQQDATGGVTSQIDIAPVSFRQSPIHMDMRVRTDSNHVEANRFSMNLFENGSSPCFATLCIRPGAQAYIAYQNTSGSYATKFINAFTFTDSTAYVTLRLTITDNGDGTMTLAASYYDDVTVGYVSLGDPVTDAATQTGVFDMLRIWSRNANGSSGNRVYFNLVDITSATPPGYVRQATGMIREMLNFLGCGFERVNYYRLHGSEFGFTENDLTPRQSYTAIQALMEDAISIEHEAINLSDGVPAVASYSGTKWPLMTVPIVGRASALDSQNTVLFALWQRNYATRNTSFLNAVSPQSEMVTLTVPSGYVVESAWDTRTRQGVLVTVNGASVILDVGSDPVIVKIIPSP